VLAEFKNRDGVRMFGAYYAPPSTSTPPGKKVPLEQLRYWSAELQEAYAGPAEALKRWQETHPA